MKRRVVLKNGWALLIAGSIFSPLKVSPFSRSATLTLRNMVSSDTYITKGNLYKEIFTEPIESMMFLFVDGRFYIFTSCYPHKVEGQISAVVEYFEKKEKQQISDLVLVVHNHLDISRFSEQDDDTYRYLKQSGFAGRFLIFYPGTEKVAVKK